MKAVWLLLLLATPAWGNDLQCNEKGIALIKEYEGFRDTAYQDANGNWTIGYGHTRDVTPNMRITPQEGEKLLCGDISETEQALTRMVKKPLSGNQFSALVSLAYNIGLGNFAKSSVFASINAGLFASVPQAISKWNKIGGKSSNGLIRRRGSECKLWNTPDRNA